jgi:MSHA biogenesis protein MshQ
MNARKTLLITAAAAVMTLGSAAHAQVALRSASSASTNGPAIASRTPAASSDLKWTGTRFYVQNAAADVDPGTERGAWNNTSGYIARKLARTKSGAVNSRSSTESVSTADYDVLLLKLVSEPIPTAQNVAGTLTWALGARESDVAMDAHWHLHVYVLRGADTLVGTLYSNYTEAAGTNEWSTTAQGWGPTGTLVLTPRAIQANDRIVIEVGYVARNTATTSYTGTLWYGGTGGDLTVGGDETTLTGWFEFNQNLFPNPLSIPKPANVQVDDVMIASISARPNGPGIAADTVISPPAGWTQVGNRIDTTSGTGHSLVIYQKVYAGEAGPYNWTIIDHHSAVGGIQAFSDVDITANPVDVTNSWSTADPSPGFSYSTPGITTTLANTMLVTSFVTGRGCSTWSLVSAGLTEAFDVNTECYGGSALMAAYGIQPAAGATGQKTATNSDSDPSTGSTHILALRPATPGLQINKPAGTVQNDVMIASIGVRPNTVTITAPSGWTLVRRVDNGTTGNYNSLAVYRKLAGASEPASYTWTFSASTPAAGGIQSFSGVDPGTPVDVENGQSTSNGLTHATPSVTTSVSNTMIVTSHTYSSSYTWTVSGVNESFDARSEPADSDNGQSIVGSYVLQGTAGATGAKSATAAGGSDSGNTHILALRPITNGSNAYETSTPAGATTGVIKTKIAGSTISLDIIALNATKTAIATAFTGTVRVEVLNASDNSAALDGNGCRSSWTVIQTLSPDPTFASGDNGRKTISFTQANSFPEARLRLSYPAGAPTVTGCSGDPFAIRPDRFANLSVTDNNWETAGTARTLNETSASGTPVHKAGRPFTIRATAENDDGNTTTNYTGTPTVALTDCGGDSACLSTFGTLTIGAGFAAGQLNSNLATYSEVGSFELQLLDSDFASVDASDGSTASEREIRSSLRDVGRFVPDHFAVALNTPTFGTACGAGSFTYVGQGFNYTAAPVVTVTAQNFNNETTTNYAGALWRITNSSLTGKSYTAASGTVNTSGITGTDPAIVGSGSGVGTLTFRTPSFFAAGTGFFFTRTTPVAPFDAQVSLAINVIDADGVAYATNPARFGQASAGNGIAFNSGKEMRFGRLALRNANGSQLVPLAVRVEAQYWGYTNPPINTALGFITNTADTCTSIANNNVQMSSFTANLAACETAVSGAGTLSGGRRTLLLPPPGNANNGSVLLTANLGSSASGTTCTTVGGGTVSAAGANSTYLQGNWAGAPYDDNPSARAAFGTFKGAEEVIYIRENF